VRAGQLAAAVPLLGLAACERSTVLGGSTMGSTYGITIPKLPAWIEPRALRARIEGVLETVNQRMSTFRPDSELSRFNAGGAGRWHEVSADTAVVVGHAQRVNRLTGGAFDVTVGGLVNRWGFGPPIWHAPRSAGLARRQAPPAAGDWGLHARRSPPALMKPNAEVLVDLCGIAKGFGLDRVCALLDGLDIADYLVEIGGELRARGRDAAGEAWLVGIERPALGPAVLQRVIRLEDRAVATSGDYVNFYESGGRRYSHIIDPRSGAPVEHALAAVSVVARSAMTADALATALMVLGPDRGLRLARRRRLAALFMVRRGEGFAEARTPEFDRALVV